MANKTNYSQEFIKQQFRSIDGEKKLGDKVFGVRLPPSVQDILVSMPSSDRVKLMRQAIIEAVEKNHPKSKAGGAT